MLYFDKQHLGKRGLWHKIIWNSKEFESDESEKKTVILFFLMWFIQYTGTL